MYCIQILNAFCNPNYLFPRRTIISQRFNFVIANFSNQLFTKNNGDFTMRLIKNENICT